MFKFKAFNFDSKVVYVGSRWARELAGKAGWVIAPIKNQDNVYVVEFEGESYVMPESSLAKFTATATKDSGPEIRQIRKRVSEEE